MPSMAVAATVAGLRLRPVVSLDLPHTAKISPGAVRMRWPARGSRRTWLACFKVTLVTPAGEQLVEVQDGEYILDAAERAGVEVPSSCRSGACSSCAGRVRSGEVDQCGQTFLDDNQIRLGYVLTCVALPMSDAVIQTHQEEQLY